MSKVCGFLLAVPVVFFLGAASVEGRALPALNAPAKTSLEVIPTELKDSATAQIKVIIPGYTDFDAFTSVNDPLYREGSKELLKQIINNDAKKKKAPGETLRDAPISKEARPGARRPAKTRFSIEKTRVGKPLHTDPVKVKNTF